MEKKVYEWKCASVPYTLFFSPKIIRSDNSVVFMIDDVRRPWHWKLSLSSRLMLIWRARENEKKKKQIRKERRARARWRTAERFNYHENSWLQPSLRRLSSSSSCFHSVLEYTLDCLSILLPLFLSPSFFRARRDCKRAVRDTRPRDIRPRACKSTRDALFAINFSFNKASNAIYNRIHVYTSLEFYRLAYYFLFFLNLLCDFSINNSNFDFWITLKTIHAYCIYTIINVILSRTTIFEQLRHTFFQARSLTFVRPPCAIIHLCLQSSSFLKLLNQCLVRSRPREKKNSK